MWLRNRQVNAFGYDIYFADDGTNGSKMCSLYPKVGRFCENNFFKILIGSQPIIEGRSLTCGRWGKHSINLDYARSSLRKICHLRGVEGIVLPKVHLNEYLKIVYDIKLIIK